MGADENVGSSVAMKENREEERPLLESGKSGNESVISVAPSGFGYNYGHRPYRDIGFSITLAVFVTATLGVGIFAAFNHNPDYLSLGSARYDPSEGCTLPKESRHAASSKSGGGGHADVRNSLSLYRQVGMLEVLLYTFLGALILSLPLAFGLLWVLRKYTKEFVYVTLPLYVIIPTGFAIYIAVLISMSEGGSNYDYSTIYTSLGFMLAFNALFFWILYKNWDRVELTIRIIRTAAEALHQNLGLLLVLPTLNVGYLLYLIPAIFCLLFANSNGKIITNPDLVQDPDLNCGGSSGRDCCMWETDPWVPAYSILNYFVILWGLFVATEIQQFTISGTIAQWYFAVGESSTVGATKRSFLHAVGPSFGTVCCSGLIGAIISAIRSAMDKSQSERGEVGFVAIIVRACLSCLLSAVEFLTRFTTNFSAITGESFCSSAVMTYDLLRRNLLSTLVVESLTTRLLAQAIIVVSAVFSPLVWLAMSLLLRDWQPFYIGFFAFGILIGILSICVQVLESVVNTVYICFAMDKDHNEVSKPEVHDVYVLLPASKDGTASLAVSRPSGGS